MDQPFFVVFQRLPLALAAGEPIGRHFGVPTAAGFNPGIAIPGLEGRFLCQPTHEGENGPCQNRKADASLSILGPAFGPRMTCPPKTATMTANPSRRPRPNRPFRRAAEADEEYIGFDDEINSRYEEIKRGGTHITELQQMTMPQLLKIAKEENLVDYTGLKKQDLIFKILKERVKQNGLMFGEGTLEVLPDGFGFLRSPDYNYLPCPDDIYISPSQIRRFGLRTGAVVAGQIRPPKENERYFALLRVEAINYNDPELLTQKVVFDDLTPLHPDERLILETEPQRDQHARHGPGDADRQGPARPDRRPAAHRQDDPAAEDGQRVLRNHPECYVIVLLIDERPEEVTDMERTVKSPHPRSSARRSTNPPAGTCRSARW